MVSQSNYLPPTTLVIGGARSGKSAYAERLVEESGLKPVYLATATTGDDGWAATTTRAEGSSPKFTSVISHSSTTGASTSRAAATGRGGGGAWTSANNLTENRAINP